MMSKEKRRVPKLRFPGFTEDWEQRKLTSFTQRVKGNDGRMDLPTLTISASEGWLNQKDRFSANIAGSEQKNYTLLRQGELSYNHGNSKLAKYGVVYALKDYKEALVPRVYHSFRVDESYDALFVEYYFSTKRPDRELGKLVSSGARMDGLLNIGYDEFTNISISVPTFSEQKQIVALLKVCDKYITLHQRKLDNLKLKKKALLQKLFPKNGERYPELRFPGFTDAWEQCKLSDLTQLITKGTTPKVKNIQNGVNFIKVENISDDGVISINSYVSEEEHMNFLSRSILSNNDILFSIAGTLGRTAIVKSHLLPANTNQALAIIRLNKSVDVVYINTFLKSNAIKTYIRKNPTVGAQPNLSLGQVSDLEINIPSYNEQKKISNLFSKFDLMITLHQRKLDHLQLQKKALLQQMFV